MDKTNGGAEGPTERFPCGSRTTGVVSVVAVAVAVVFVVLDGVSLTHWAVVAALLLMGLGAWLTMVRPMVDAHPDHVLVRNALTDIEVPWHLVESVEVRQVLVIRTGARTVHGIAVGRSARQQLRRGRHGGGGAGPLGGLATGGGISGTDGFGRGASPAGSSSAGGESEKRRDYADIVAKRLENLVAANRRASMRRESVDKRWRWPEVIAVLGVAVAFGLLVALAAG